MRAAVLTSFSAPLEICSFPRPMVGEAEVLVRLIAAGICGSDVHMWLGKDPRTPLPIILGHEGVGVVEEIGGNRAKTDLYGKELRAGDLVVWDRAVVCGNCYYCTVKRLPNLCPNRWVYGINVGCTDPPHLRGCYADHILLDRNTKIVSVTHLGYVEPAALVAAACSGATAANAVELAGIRIGQSVLIQGAGPLGLFLIAFARARGAGKVIAVDSVPSRLRLAEGFGADLVLDYSKTTSAERRDAIVELTGGLGVDIVFEAVGGPEPIVEGFSLIAKGGSYLIVGTAIPSGTIPVDFYSDVVSKQVSVQGVWTNDTRHFCEAIDLISSHPPLFTQMVTRRFSLADVNVALESMARREVVKAVIVP